MSVSGLISYKFNRLTWQVGLSSIFLLMKSSTWRMVASPDTRTYRLSNGYTGAEWSEWNVLYPMLSKEITENLSLDYNYNNLVWLFQI